MTVSEGHQDGPSGGAPQVSVIVPAYNAAWCIERLMASVAAQTLSDFEVIVVNDGSSDGTAALVEAFAANDRRFRLVTQQNGGAAAARNRGLSEVRGQYVAPVDADDLWSPNYLQEMVAALEAPGAEGAPFAFCYSHWIDEEDRYRPEPPPSSPPRADFIGLLRHNPVGNGSCSVMRREQMLAVGGYDGTLRPRGSSSGEDWKLVLELAALGDPVVVPKPLVGYRRTNHSLSSDPLLQAKSSLIVLDDMRRRFPHIPARHFWAARTDFLVWVLPQWARRRDFPSLAKYGALAYLANPFWMSSPQARHLLSRTVRGLLGRAKQERPPGPMLKFGESTPSSDGQA